MTPELLLTGLFLLLAALVVIRVRRRAAAMLKPPAPSESAPISGQTVAVLAPAPFYESAAPRRPMKKRRRIVAGRGRGFIKSRHAARLRRRDRIKSQG